MTEELLFGGNLVSVIGASGRAVEGVKKSHRGLVVYSASAHLDGGVSRRGAYKLTQRAVQDTDLWRVRRLPSVEA